MDIGIKYCGGCNPRYDRLEFVSRLMEALPHHEYRYGSEDQEDVMLVVCGCKRTCANFSKDKASSIIVIDDDSSVESIIEVIQISEK